MAESDTMTIYLHDGIGEPGNTSADVLQAILSMPQSVKTIRVHINSLGGFVHHGLAIYNALRAHPAKVITVVDGLAASAASLIAMAGDERHMASGAMEMVHNPNIEVSGEKKDLESAIQSLDKSRDALLKIYVERTGLSEAKVSEIMDAQTWLSDSEAKALGFATHIDTDLQAVTAAYDFSNVGSVPAKVAAALAAFQSGKARMANASKAVEDEDQKKKEAEAKANAEDDEKEDDEDAPVDDLDLEDEDEDEKKEPSAKAAVALLNKYSKAFGPKAAGKYLQAGLTYPQALERHNKSLVAKVHSVNGELAEAKSEIIALKAQMKLLKTGEETPLKGSPSAKGGTTGPKSLADVLAKANAAK